MRMKYELYEVTIQCRKCRRVYDVLKLTNAPFCPNPSCNAVMGPMFREEMLIHAYNDQLEYRKNVIRGYVENYDQLSSLYVRKDGKFQRLLYGGRKNACRLS